MGGRTGNKRSVPAPPGFYGCAVCKEIKPVAEFHPAQKGPDGHDSRCKACKQAFRVERRERLTGKDDPTIRARFDAKYRKAGPDECWVWTAARTKRGYGSIFFQGRDELAHRVAWVLAGNAMPQLPQVIDHICKNLGCINVRHLRVVTQAENTRDLAPSSVSFNNAAKTHCSCCGTELAGANLAIAPGAFNQDGSRRGHRQCLTCYPQYWSWAVIERTPPPRSKLKAWRGPFRPDPL